MRAAPGINVDWQVRLEDGGTRQGRARVEHQDRGNVLWLDNLPDGYHKLIARAAKNPILEMLSESMLEVASKVISELHPSIDVLKHVLKCHKDVFEAIRSGDGDRAFEVMTEHILDVQKRLSDHTTNGERKARKASKKRR